MAKVMIVDDSGLMRRMLRSMLESGGHTVLEANAGEQALTSYARTRPDLVFLDLNLDDMPGIEVLAGLRRIDAHARVVMLTGDEGTAARDESLAAGAAGFLRKPIRRADQLLETVRKLSSDDPSMGVRNLAT